MSLNEFEIDETEKKRFASVVILDLIIRQKKTIPVWLEGEDKDLEPLLEYMMMKQYLQAGANGYEPTNKGSSFFEQFLNRYLEFLRIYDVYCAIDLENGEFAFTRYFDFDSEEAWEDFLNQERWEDLRVAVAGYKGIDPFEVVFMSMLDEGAFPTTGSGWQFDLLLGQSWSIIADVLRNSLTEEELAYTDSEGRNVSGAEVLEDIIIQGAELRLALSQREQSEASDQLVSIETLKRYKNPQYRSDIWDKNIYE